MVVYQRDTWGIWLYIILISVMYGNTAVLLMAQRTLRSPMVALASLLFGALALGWTMTALLLANVPDTPVERYAFILAQRFCWVLVTISACILVDLGLARIGRYEAGVSRLLRWCGRAPRQRMVSYVLLIVMLCLMAACAPAPGVYGTQAEPPDAARGHFIEGALYSCSGVVMGMAGLMGLEINMQVQTVAIGVCTIYANRVTEAVWDGGVLPRSEAPIVPMLPSDPT